MTNCEPDCIVTTPVPATAPELNYSKVLSAETGGSKPGIAEPGETLTYTLTVENTGDEDATDVSIIDTFSYRKIIESAEPSVAQVFDPGTGITTPSVAGVFDPLTGVTTWSGLTVPAGGGTVQVTLAITLKDPLPDYVKQVTNTMTCPDPDDQACIVTTPTDADTYYGNITVIKRAEVHQVHRGDKVPYTIIVTNTAPVTTTTVTITDRIPSGFRYVAGTALLDSVPVEPTIDGQLLSFPNVTLVAQQSVELRLELLVLSSVKPGVHKNFANAMYVDGTFAGPDAIAEVVVAIDSIFDCSEILGKVFDDADRNGYQDEGEIGLPGVRIATVNGLLITSDRHGRYHVPCADIPEGRGGSNFIMKLDTRTLPTGYRITTENPRVIRLTPGKMSKMNFGAALGRVLRIDLTDEAFVSDGVELAEVWSAKLESVMDILRQEQTVLRLSYIDAGAEHDLAVERIDALKERIEAMWKASAGRYRLDIETQVETSR
jgi:uncharacterized repeat protein (TIGR01451 family)